MMFSRPTTCVTRIVQAVAVILAYGLTHPAWAQEVIIEQMEARQIARENGWLIRQETPTGVIELASIVNGAPWYNTTHNRAAAVSISTDLCQPGGSSGLALTGSGVTLGVWDAAGVRLTHQEFGSRASQGDVPGATHWHSTHVAGTMIASGVVLGATGMAPSASVDCYDWSFDVSEMRAAAAAGMRVSNHSYGFVQGWYYDSVQGEWWWYGDRNVSDLEDYRFGLYGGYSYFLDVAAHDYPYYLICRSAGNDRDQIGPDPNGPGEGGHFHMVTPFNVEWEYSTDLHDADGDYDSITTRNTAKNILTVGAVEDVIGGYAGPGGVVMSSFSGWGPTDDGRIKPDITGNGVTLYSAFDGSDTDYSTLSGTSMAAPSVAGSLGLLVEHWRATHAGADDMLSSSLKGLVLHTADEAGSANGPDYAYGWGLMNTLTAANAISSDVPDPMTISEWTLNDGGSIELLMTTDGTSDLHATICWTDPPGPSQSGVLDPATKILVNDLDLRIERVSPLTTYQPWVLNPAIPSAAATTGDNNRDNVEQVVVYTPGVGDFALRITHKGTLSGGAQNVSVLISGASAIQACSVAGTVALDQTQYGCDGTVSIDVVDCDLDTNSSVVETAQVVLTSTTEPLPGEVVTLTETSAGSAVFRGSIALDTIDSAGVLRIVANDTVTAIYTDADDGVSGVPVDVMDVATVDLGASTARIWADLEIDAFDLSPITRDVSFVITECTGPSTQSVSLPVTFTNKQALGVLLDDLVATPVPEWISVRQGHTLARLRPLTFDGCNEATIDLTGANHLHSGDFHTATVPQDDLVDITDFSILASQWNQPIDAGESAGGDATGDGVQDTADYSTLQVNAFTRSEGVDGCAGGRSDEGPSGRHPTNVAEMAQNSVVCRADLMLAPQPRSITLGTTFDILLIATATRPDGAVQSIAAIDAVVRWDPLVMELVGVVDNGPYGWAQSGFPDDSALDGLNDTFLDGDAKYTALAGLADPAMAPPSGLLVTTLRFVAHATDEATGIWLEPAWGPYSRTQVFGGDAPNHIVTGDLCDAGIAVVWPQECDGDGDVDLYEFHRLQACYTGSVPLESGPTAPAYPPDAELCCAAFDYDDDGDVDASDFKNFVGWAVNPTH